MSCSGLIASTLLPYHMIMNQSYISNNGFARALHRFKKAITAFYNTYNTALRKL